MLHTNKPDSVLDEGLENLANTLPAQWLKTHLSRVHRLLHPSELLVLAEFGTS